MNTINSSADTCAICLGALEEESNEGLPHSLLPAFIRRHLAGDPVVMLKPCDHKFHLTCINRWLNESPRCPFDQRVITGSSPPSLLSINLHNVLFRSIEDNQIKDVQDILSAGLTPLQLSCPDGMNPLTLALEKSRWEIATQLLAAGWTTEDKVALNNLGWMYCNGLGVKQNYPEALTYFHKAACLGSSSAENNLGWMYYNGLGVRQDYSEALSRYRKAADQGNPDAQNNLGWMYENGLAVEQDYAEALYWYHKSANQGNVKAPDNINSLIANGHSLASN